MPCELATATSDRLQIVNLFLYVHWVPFCEAFVALGCDICFACTVS